MVSLTNGLLSEGSQQRLLENCYHSSSSSGHQPKYKPRKVSATRDFPPGCGRNAPKTNKLPEGSVAVLDENGNVDPAAANCVTSFGEHEGTQVGEDMNITLDNLVVQVGSFATKDAMVNGIKNVEFGTKVFPQKFESLKELVNVELDVPRKLHVRDDRALVDELPKEENGSGLVKSTGVEEKKGLLKNEANGVESENLLVENGAMSDNLVSKDSAKSCFLGKFPFGGSSVVEEKAASQRNKYHMRRVSASRDFPPFCGRETPRPTEEDRLRIAGIKSSRDFGKTLERTETFVETICVMDGRTLRNVSQQMIERKVMKGDTGERGGCIAEKTLERREVLTKTLPIMENKTSMDNDDSVKIQSEKSVDESSKFLTMTPMDNEDSTTLVETIKKGTVVRSSDRNLNIKPLDGVDGLGDLEGRVIVLGLMAAPFCPWRQGRVKLRGSVGENSGSKLKKSDSTRKQKSKLVTETNSNEADKSSGKAVKKRPVSAGKAASGGSTSINPMDLENQLVFYEGQPEDFPAYETKSAFDVSLPPFGPNITTHGDARNRVRETLRLFQAICRKLLQGEEAKFKQGEESNSHKKGKDKRRNDLLAAQMIKEKGKELNTGKNIVGAVPGVEVGDEFQFRVELAIVGLHRLYQAGIDYTKVDGEVIATSIVASGAYADDLENADALIYSGQGGNVIGKDKQPEDQKLERGNLALKNSISVKNPVRVVRGWKEKTSDSLYGKGKMAASYVYDGLYTVEKYWTDTGRHGKMVFMFELRRNSGQPELAWKEVKRSKKYKIREGLCVDDISSGKELFPICAVNTIDDVKPAPFTYITKMIYPDWYSPIPPNGCDCIGRCSYSRKCLCAAKNGGEIPYNYNGAIVEAKPLVYECGPACKCPPNCYNRVSQHGPRIQLEIFKTETRGWGVRSLSSIASGTFICEYTGELLQDKEAEQRIGNDEYLFDIGQNYNDCSHMTDMLSELSEVVEEDGFTIDAAQYGSVGRFINHSCSPNLYAQNVLYDHEDRRMPHIMFFAAENIPPLQELTYHYNYSVDEVRDLNGDVKRKSCYCGSAECTGRMY